MNLTLTPYLTITWYLIILEIVIQTVNQASLLVACLVILTVGCLGVCKSFPGSEFAWLIKGPLASMPAP